MACICVTVLELASSSLLEGRLAVPSSHHWRTAVAPPGELARRLHVSISGYQDRKAIMNRFEWTFSGSAELVTGLLLAAVIVVMAFA
jgi:hypothetical protein